jgi:hypothetical protein
MDIETLRNKEISVIVDGMQNAVGGVLVSFDDTFLVLESRTGNTIRITHTHVASILTKTDGGTKDEIRQR